MIANVQGYVPAVPYGAHVRLGLEIFRLEPAHLRPVNRELRRHELPHVARVASRLRFDGQRREWTREVRH